MCLCVYEQHKLTAVFGAAKRGHKEVVRYLMEKKGCCTIFSDDVSLMAHVALSPAQPFCLHILLHLSLMYVGDPAACSSSEW